MFAMFVLIWKLLGLGLTLLEVVLLARAIITFVPAWQKHPMGRLVTLLAAPLLLPFRRIARIGGPGIGIDFSPMLALMIVHFVRTILPL